MRTVLDTSVLLGTEPTPIEGDLAISVASLAELHFGVLVARSDPIRAERLRRLAVIESSFDPLPVDAQVARAYGRLAAALALAGRRPRARVMDLLIAATAVAHGARLCTRNSAISRASRTCWRSQRSSDPELAGHECRCGLQGRAPVSGTDWSTEVAAQVVLQVGSHRSDDVLVAGHSQRRERDHVPRHEEPRHL